MKAAELGSVDAQARIGKMLLRGDFVRQSPEYAVHWLGELSLHVSRCDISLLHDEKDQPHRRVLMSWVRVSVFSALYEEEPRRDCPHYFAGLAAGKGNLNATVSLGEAYIEGLGVRMDVEYGLGLLNVAARGEFRAGYRALGMCSLEVGDRQRVLPFFS